MGLPIFREQRLSARRKLTGLLPGRLTTAEGEDIKCQPRDVSKHGLGFVCSQQIEIDSILHLTIKDQVIELTVSWRQPGFGKTDEFRYGVVCKDRSIDLENAFIESGCLK